MKDKTTLYPSNWLYNASVIGFLKLLNKEDFKQVEFSSGAIKLPKEWFIANETYPVPYVGKLLINKLVSQEDLEKWLSQTNNEGKTNEEKYKEFVEKYFHACPEEGYKYVRAYGHLFASKKPFQNLVQLKEWLNFQFFKLVERFVAEEDGDLRCSFCGRKNIPLDFLEKAKTLERRLIVFANPHAAELGASTGEFPNSFWNNENSIFICPFCVYLFIHHRFAFVPTSESEVFINAHDFELTWDLNKLVENLLARQRGYGVRKILGFTLLEWAIKEKVLLSVWTMMNIEAIVRKEGTIDYFDLQPKTTEILLDHEIAGLIKKIDEEKIFDLILAGNFAELEKANYFALKTICKLKLKENEEINENDPITKYFDRYNNLQHLKKASLILPKLFSKILEKNEEVGMEKKIDILIRKLQQRGQSISNEDNFKNLADAINKLGSRLLEQVRLGNKDNVYYMLLRCFHVNGQEFPSELIDAFKPENEKYFKILIFSFLAPILGKEDKEVKESQETQAETEGGEV
jgi:CRISPR-associated protein Cst1